MGDGGLSKKKKKEGRATYHRVLHVGVYARLLSVDTDLDRIVDTPVISPSAICVPLRYV